MPVLRPTNEHERMSIIMGIKIPYQYKVYRDGPKATMVDKLLHKPSFLSFFSIVLCFLLILIGSGIYNIASQRIAILRALGGIAMFAGLIVMFAGPFVIPRLADKLHIADRVYEKETGRKIY